MTMPAPDGFSARAAKAANFVPSSEVRTRSSVSMAAPAIGLIGGKASCGKHMVGSSWDRDGAMIREEGRARQRGRHPALTHTASATLERQTREGSEQHDG